MKFVHISDCHLSQSLKFNKSNSNFIREKIWENFENIFYSNRDADFFLIAGDLYERNFFTLNNYRKMFSIIEKYGNPVFYVTGNHDYIDKDNEIFFSNKPQNLIVFDNNKLTFVEKENYRIYGMSYSDRISSLDFDYGINLDYNFFNILLLHADVYDINSDYLYIDLKKLEKLGFNYVGLGHIHKREKFDSNIYYSGSIEPSSFSDIYKYGYNIYNNGYVNQLDSSFLKFYKIDLDCNRINNLEGIISYLEQILENKINFVRLNIKNHSENLNINSDFLKDRLDIYYLEINYLDGVNDYNSLIKLYPNSILSNYYSKMLEFDLKSEVNKRALEIGLDAILRSKDD